MIKRISIVAMLAAVAVLDPSRPLHAATLRASSARATGMAAVGQVRALRGFSSVAVEGVKGVKAQGGLKGAGINQAIVSALNDEGAKQVDGILREGVTPDAAGAGAEEMVHWMQTSEEGSGSAEIPVTFGALSQGRSFLGSIGRLVRNEVGATNILPSRERNEQNPDNNYSWADRFTNQVETQATKIGKARDLALTHPLTAKIYERLEQNGARPIYKVVPTDNADYYSRVLGDDPEIPGERENVVILTSWILPNLSLESIAADIASQFASLWYGKYNGAPVRQSAEKNYIKGSVLSQVFAYLSGSTPSRWVGRLDHRVGATRRGEPIFRIYQHYNSWLMTAGQGVETVRTGNYFLNKIIRQEGYPYILTDARGRQTLYGRLQSQDITDQEATIGQKTFAEFVSYVDRVR